MESISNLISVSNAPAILYYAGMTIVSVFLGGWMLNTKIKNILEAGMKVMDTRISKLETESLRVDVHNKDLINIFQLFNDLRNDFKDGFKGLNSRIDQLLLATTKD